MSFSKINLNFRKWKIFIKKRYIILLICFILPILFIILFLPSNLICLKSTLDSKTSEICDKFYRHEYTGKFCNEICTKPSLQSVECPQFNMRHEAVLFGQKKGQKYILKYANSIDPIDPIKWIDSDGKSHYPSEKEFLHMVNRSIFFKYNIVLQSKELKNLINLHKTGDFKILHHSMDNIWQLIHNNDFMLGKLLDGKELFPKVLGSCGPYFAIEYITPFSIESHMEILSVTDWKHRLQKAVLILDFLEELDTNQPESVTMCDMKFNNFGISENRLKYLKLDHVHSTIFIDRYVSDAKYCWKDVQCSYKYCKSKCSKNIEKCTNRQLNNNLQIACDKIFRGSTYSPGILVTSRTPNSLLQILDKCASPQNNIDADPFHPLGPSKEIRNVLYTELINVYDSLNSL